jgi:hypothetical protein
MENITAADIFSIISIICLIYFVIAAIVQNVRRGTIATFFRRLGVALLAGCGITIVVLIGDYLVDGKVDGGKAWAIAYTIAFGHMLGSGWAFKKQDEIRVEPALT